MVNEIQSPEKLDIACGSNKKEGYVGIDRMALAGVDIVHDLDVIPWPISDGCVIEANISHYVEHVRDLCAFANELYRIMATGGKAYIAAPYYSSIRAWQDPTHVRAISEASFLYWNKAWRDSQGLSHYPITCDFDFTFGYGIGEPWSTRSEDARNFAIRHYMNVVNDVYITLTKR